MNSAPTEQLRPDIKGFPGTVRGEVSIAASFCKGSIPEAGMFNGYWVLSNLNLYIVASATAKIVDQRIPRVLKATTNGIPLAEIAGVRAAMGRKSSMTIQSRSGKSFTILSDEKGISRLLNVLNKVLLPYYHVQLLENENGLWTIEPVPVDQSLQDRYLEELAAIQSKSINYINSPKAKRRENDRKSNLVLKVVIGIIIAIAWVASRVYLRSIR